MVKEIKIPMMKQIKMMGRINKTKWVYNRKRKKKETIENKTMRMEIKEIKEIMEIMETKKIFKYFINLFYSFFL